MVGATWRWLDWRLVLAASGKRNLGTPGTPGTLFWWRVVEPISWMSQDPLQRERERERALQAIPSKSVSATHLSHCQPVAKLNPRNHCTTESNSEQRLVTSRVWKYQDLPTSPENRRLAPFPLGALGGPFPAAFAMELVEVVRARVRSDGLHPNSFSLRS